MYYQPRRRGDKPFPVADDFFPQPLALSAQRLAALRAEAAEALTQTLEEYTVYQRARGTYLVNTPPWRAHADVDGLNEYKRPHKTRANTSESRVFGTIPGDYHNLAQFLHSETRDDYFNVQKKLFSYTIDAAVLYTAPVDREASPLAYEGIKWAAYEPFSLRFRTDTCHFESMGTGVDAHGKPFAYRILLPVSLPEVPDLFKTKRTVRMTSTSVLLLLPSDRNANATEIFLTMENDFKSNVVPRSLFKRFLLSLHKLHVHVGHGHASGSTSAVRYVRSMPRNEWVPSTSHDHRSVCGVCTRPFPMLRSKRTCFVCGELVCRKCLVKSSDVLQVKPVRRDEAATSRMCTPCIKLLREDREHPHTTPVHQPIGGDIWEKSPTIHEPLRMSETPTETSYGEVATASFRFSSDSISLSASSSPTGSSHGDETSGLRPSRFSFSTLHRTSCASDRSSSSRRPSMVSLTSPISVVGGPNEEIEYIDDDEDVIYEEDPDMLSHRSVDEMVVLDTNDMERVRHDSISVFSTTSSTHSHSHSQSASNSRSASVSSEEVFNSINSALHEQEVLLRQLQAAASRARRDARSRSSVSSTASSASSDVS